VHRQRDRRHYRACDEAFLVDNGIIKGAMNLIDAERAVDFSIRAWGRPSRLPAAAPATPRRASPPSAAEPPISARWRATSSARSTRMTSGRSGRGLRYAAAGRPPPTARSMIFVTPDGERSMNTYLGACVELGPEDVEGEG
jgi:hypothetical protein